MKIAALIARILLGIIFVFFGLNGFLHFLNGPLPPGLAGQFIGALMQSHYVLFVSAFQVISGVLLLINRYVPLAVAILAPILVNILVFHITMAPAGLPLAIFVAILCAVIFVDVRSAFSPLFQPCLQARA